MLLCVLVLVYVDAQHLSLCVCVRLCACVFLVCVLVLVVCWCVHEIHAAIIALSRLRDKALRGLWLRVRFMSLACTTKSFLQLPERRDFGGIAVLSRWIGIRTIAVA